MTRFSRIAPLPPRDITFVNGVLRWKPPLYHKERVTHYRIYVNDTSTREREVPAGQTVINDLLAGDRFFISSYNHPSGLESHLTLLEGPFVPLVTTTQWRHVFGVDNNDEGAEVNDVTNSVNAHSTGSPYRIVANQRDWSLSGVVDTKVDIEWSEDGGVGWDSIITGAVKIVIPNGQVSPVVLDPITTPLTVTQAMLDDPNRVMYRMRLLQGNWSGIEVDMFGQT